MPCEEDGGVVLFGLGHASIQILDEDVDCISVERLQIDSMFNFFLFLEATFQWMHYLDDATNLSSLDCCKGVHHSLEVLLLHTHKRIFYYYFKKTKNKKGKGEQTLVAALLEPVGGFSRALLTADLASFLYTRMCLFNGYTLCVLRTKTYLFRSCRTSVARVLAAASAPASLPSSSTYRSWYFAHKVGSFWVVIFSTQDLRSNREGT